MAEIFASIALLFFFCVIGVSLFYERKVLVPPAPTLPWVKRRIIQALYEHLPAEEFNIVELGSGWGGLCFSLSRKFPQARVAGFELSPFPYWFSRAMSLFYSRVSFRRADFFEQDLSGFQVAVFYLTPKLTERLAQKLRQDMKPGSLVISNAFALPGWEPIQTLESRVFVRIPIYIYRV